MKWQATEKKKGVRDYERGDQIRALFDEWQIPLSGNRLLIIYGAHLYHTNNNANKEILFFGRSIQKRPLSGTEMN